MKKQQKLKLIGGMWVAAIATGISAEVVGFFYLAALCFVSSVAAIIMTGAYIMENWDSYE